MGTTAQKLEYLGTTKSQLKDMINYGLPTENQITNETTFRNYVSSIFEAFIESLRDSTTLYTNLPKISGNGTQITLNDTANAPMRITLKASALEQQTTTGKNLYNALKSYSWQQSSTASWEFIDGSSGASGTNIGTKTLLKAPVESGKTYTFTASVSASSSIVSQLVYGDETLIKRIDGATVTFSETFTSAQDGYVLLRLYMGANVSVSISNVMLRISTASADYEPYTGGTASPNPEYPQDIHTISGNNSVVVEGANLYNYEDLSDASDGVTTDSEGWITCTYDNSSGTSAVYRNYYTYNLNIEPNTNYNIIFEVKTKTGTFNNVSITSYQASTNKGQFPTNRKYYNEISQNTTYNIISTSRDSWSGDVGLRTIVQYNGGDSGTIKFRISVIKNTSITPSTFTYTPYVSQTAPLNLDTIEYCKIGNYEDEFILTSGKNLFDGEIELGGLDNSTGEPISNNASLRTKNYISVKPNTTYTISNNKNYHIRVYFYGSSYNFISLDSTNYQSVATFTTPNNASYIKFRTNSGTTENDLTSLWQLELGTSASSYEPYGTNQWYLKKNIGKVVLDGSESWTFFSVTQGNLFRNTTKILNDINDSNYTPYSNYFKGIPFSQKDNRTNNNFYIGSIDNTLDFMDNRFDNVDDWKDWLSTHNTIVYYILSTPTYTQITGELETQLENIYEKLLSYKGTTNISQVNNDLPFVLGVSAIEDLE